MHRAGDESTTPNDWRSAEMAYTEAIDLKQKAGAPP
jgi:hypothetical protein